MIDTARPYNVTSGEFPHLDIYIDGSTVVDLTSSVHNGHLKWQAPNQYANYTVIALYERYTNERSCKAGQNATSFVGNGSWVTDHFSAQGAQRVTSFLDENLIYGDVKDLLRSVGGCCKIHLHPDYQSNTFTKLIRHHSLGRQYGIPGGALLDCEFLAQFP